VAIVLQSKPGLSSTTTLNIPKTWDPTWFRSFISNQLKGADVRNAVGANGISVTGNISSPYATITIGNGPIVIPAPTTSALALTVNGIARTGYGPTVLIQAPDTASESNGLQIIAGTNTNDASFVVTNAAHTFNVYNLIGDSEWSYFRGPVLPTLAMSANGNLSLQAPASGNALSVYGVAGAGNSVGYFSSAQGTAGGTSDVLILRSGSTANSAQAGPCIGLGDSIGGTFSILQQSGGQTELWQYSGAWNQILKVLSTRGVVINAPASGQTLTLAPSPSAGELIATSAALTTGAGAAVGTLTNAPSAGNPTKWIKINDNGTIRSVPAW
jgi:hypothetical protein